MLNLQKSLTINVNYIFVIQSLYEILMSLLIVGFKILLDVFGVQSGTVEEGVRLMEQGQILAIAPGFFLKSQ